jgi:hypothetical protein
MLASLRSARLLARTLHTVVVADACTLAYLVLDHLAVMLTHHRSATLLALALATVAVAGASSPAYLALACTCPCGCYSRMSVIRHTHCTRSSHGCGGRSRHPRIPCTCFVGGYAQISTTLMIRHTPCTCSSHASGGRCLRPRAPCTDCTRSF